MTKRHSLLNSDDTISKVKRAIETAKAQIDKLKEGRQTKDNLERIKQYEDQIKYLTDKLPGLENGGEDDDLMEYIKVVMGEPARPRKNSRGQAGRVVPLRFIEPGLVNYADVGMVLVKKETLDRMLPSIVGTPIFNRQHKEVSGDDFSSGRADGIIAGNPRFDASDGWFWVDALVWDDETIQNCKSGYSLSCAYDVTRWGPGGVHNNIPYDREVLDGEYTHLAIVDNPRYEGARLIINQGGHMKLKFWQKDKANEPREMELVNAMTDLGGAETPMEKVIELANAELKRQEELKNAKATDDSIIEVGGKQMTVKEAKDLALAALKNADSDAMEKAHKDGKHDDKEMDNCPMCNAEDEEEKKEKDRKNAEDEAKKKKDKEDMENRKNEEDHESDKHKDKPVENCLSCKAETARKNAEHFESIRNARQRGEGEFREPGIRTSAERVAEGQKRYGGPKS
jgi:hypothetical protein